MRVLERDVGHNEGTILGWASGPHGKGALLARRSLCVADGALCSAQGPERQ